MQVKGQITIRCLDLMTREVISETSQENIITEAFGAYFFPGYRNNSMQLQLDVILSTASIEPSFYGPRRALSGNGFETVARSGDILGVPQRQLIESVGTDPDIIQFASRFNPPSAGTTRTIRTVALMRSDHVASTTYDQNTLLPAYSKLDTPCVQTDTQIYDIYYRIFVTFDETSDISKEYLRIMIKRALAQSGFSSWSTSFSNSSNYTFYPKVTIPSEDRVNVIVEDAVAMSNGLNDVDGLNVLPNSLYYGALNKTNSFSPNPYLVKTKTLGFNDNVGVIMNSMNMISSAYYPRYVNTTRLFEQQSKIQNIFGYNVESTNSASPAFLDVDNLATGTGTIAVTGNWENIETHANDDLYFKTALPERNTVKITTGGNVGASSYQYIKEKYVITAQNGLNDGTTWATANWNVATEIPYLANYTFSYFLNRGILGNVDQGVFDIEQASASIAFDDSSILIPKKDKIVLYSIAGSRYWNISGGFTNIHQLEVFNGVIYIACRNTGLYTCDPRVSLTATKISITSPRTVDLSACHGVCLGTGKIWAVANDALCSFDGTTWSVYDSTSANPFGSSPAIFASINYIKAAKDSASDQMFLVYNTSNTKIGFWWSPTTPVLELNINSATFGYGAVKRNRQHVKICHGFVYYWNSDIISRSAFNTSTATPVITSFLSNYGFSIVQNSTGTTTLLAACFSGSASSPGNIRTDFYDHTGTLISSVQSSAFGFPASSTHNMGSAGINESSFNDPYKTIIDLGGVFVYLNKIKTSKVKVIFAKAPYLLPTQHGGSYAYLCRQTYGWDGSNWVLNHPGSKLTHASSQPLLDGISINFNEGTTGTSFVSGNHYKFGLCEGLMKDNATRVSHTTPDLFVKTVKGIAQLSSVTVPALTSLPTGVVDIHPTHKSRNAVFDGSNRVIFPGNTEGQFAVGDKQITGDFHLTISCADLGNAQIVNRTIVGIGKRHKGSRPLIGFTMTSASGMAVYTSIHNTGLSNTLIPTEATNIYNYSSLTTSSVIGIRRVGSIITLTRDGANVFTVVLTGLMTDVDQRLDVMFATADFSSTTGTGASSAYRALSSICPAVTIAVNGQDNAVMLGDSTLGTEAYDIRCRCIVAELGATVRLAGVIVPVRFTGNLPVPGEVCIDANSLTAIFNPADVGKAVQIECTRAWDL